MRGAEVTDNETLALYEQRFGMVHPPLDYGHHAFTVEELAELAREALATGEPIPWDDLLAPLPPGCES